MAVGRTLTTYDLMTQAQIAELVFDDVVASFQIAGNRVAVICNDMVMVFEMSPP